VIELIVDGLVGDTHRLGLGLIRGVDARLDAQHDLAHEIHHGGESQLAGVLHLGGTLEKCIDPVGIQQTLKHAACHHANRTLLDKRREQ